jgi:hypothetical protein
MQAKIKLEGNKYSKYYYDFSGATTGTYTSISLARGGKSYSTEALQQFMHSDASILYLPQ